MVADTEKAHALVQVLLNLKGEELAEHIRYNMWCEGGVEAFLTETIIPGYSLEAAQGMNGTIDWLYELVMDSPVVYDQMLKTERWIETTYPESEAWHEAKFKTLTKKIRSVVVAELKKLI